MNESRCFVFWHKYFSLRSIWYNSNRRQAVDWTKDDPIYWRHMASLCHDDFAKSLSIIHSAMDILSFQNVYDDVSKWKHFPRCWPFVSGRFPFKRPATRSFWCFSLICAWTNGWANSWYSGDLRQPGAYHDVIVIMCLICGDTCQYDCCDSLCVT